VGTGTGRLGVKKPDNLRLYSPSREKVTLESRDGWRTQSYLRSRNEVVCPSWGEQLVGTLLAEALCVARANRFLGEIQERAKVSWKPTGSRPRLETACRRCGTGQCAVANHLPRGTRPCLAIWELLGRRERPLVVGCQYTTRRDLVYLRRPTGLKPCWHGN